MKEKIEDIVKDYIRWSINMFLHRDRVFQVKPKDKFIISYPKSGNTWVRFLVANLLFNKKIDLVNIEKLILDLYKNNPLEIGKYRRKQHHHIFKSHTPYRPKFNNNKVIYVVRDVRDVVISYYFYYQKVNQIEIKFNNFFSKFIKGQISPSFGNWGNNVGSWLGAKKMEHKEFLLIRFEDLKKDTLTETERIKNFLGIKASKKELQKAVEKSSFNNLKTMEEKVEDEAPETKNTNKKIKFFRKGKSGEWENMLNKKQKKILKNKFGYLMKELQYLD